MISDKLITLAKDPLCNRRHFIFSHSGCHFLFHRLASPDVIGTGGVKER